MSKKVMSIVLAIIIAALGISLAACSNNNEDNTTTTGTTTTTAAPVTQRTPDGKFIVGFDASFPPMGFTKDDGTYDGFDLDIAKAVAAKLGLEYVEVPIVWDNKDMALEAGNIDCIWNGFTMHVDDRDDLYTWTDAYMLNQQVIVVLKNSKANDLAALEGKKCGVQAGSTAKSAIKENAQFEASIAEIIEKPDNNAVLTDLEAGVIDFAVMDSVVANYKNTQKNGAYKILSTVLADEEFGIGFNLGNTALRDKVQTALRELYADGSLKTISNKWFGKDVFINMTPSATTTTASASGATTTSGSATTTTSGSATTTSKATTTTSTATTTTTAAK